MLFKIEINTRATIELPIFISSYQEIFHKRAF